MPAEMFALKRQEDGYWATKPGSEHSYSRHMEHAHWFPSRDAAEAERCGNEYIVALSEAVAR